MAGVAGHLRWYYLRASLTKHPQGTWGGRAEADVGVTVHLPHDPFEHAGGQIEALLVTEEEPGGGAVGDEGERVRSEIA